jgi:hypothetical protein
MVRRKAQRIHSIGFSHLRRLVSDDALLRMIKKSGAKVFVLSEPCSPSNPDLRVELAFQACERLGALK